MKEPVFQRIHVNELHVDPIVQRALDPNRAAKMAEKFTPEATGALVVNHREDGKYFIVDGQHRHAAAVTAKYDGKLSCIVHEALPIEKEATLFLSLNDSRLVSAIDKFRMRVIAHEDDATVISNVLEKYGWRASIASTPGCVAAVVALEKIYNGAGVLKAGSKSERLVDLTMSTITRAWGHSYMGSHAAIIGGLGQLFARYSAGQVDVDKLCHEMSKTRPVDLVTKAKSIKENQGGTVPAAMAKVLVGLHNKARRTNRLPEWQWTR